MTNCDQQRNKLNSEYATIFIFDTKKQNFKNFPGFIRACFPMSFSFMKIFSFA